MPYSNRQLSRILDPELIPAGDYPERIRVAQSLIKRATFTVEDRAVNDLMKLYRTALADVRETLYTTAERLGIRKLKRDEAGRAWRQAVQQPMAARVNRLATDSAALALKAATVAWYGGYVGCAWMLDTNTPADTRVHVRNIPRQQVAQWLAGMVGIQEDEYADIINDTMGREWRQLFSNELDAVTAAVKRAIWNGMGAGEGIPDIIKRVEDVFGSYGKAGYTANFNRVQTITRTVVNQASNNGAINVYRDNPDVLTGYEWLTAKDERVCPTCRGLNGTTYALTDYYRPPAHYNCRCTIIPILKTADNSLSSNTSTMPTLTDWAATLGMEWMINDFLKPKTTTPIGDEYEDFGLY